MKKISICLPCYNEELNIEPMSLAIKEIMNHYAGIYEYEIIFADNCSTDSSREVLRELASHDNHVKVILNTRNFGPVASNRNGILSASGDAVITMVCDFQDPPELIKEFIAIWEKGNLIVAGQKIQCEEKGLKKLARSVYYKIIDKLSDTKQCEQVTGFAIYDRKVVEGIRCFDDANIALRHVIAKLGYPIYLIPYTQRERKAGKSSYNLLRYLDFSITSLVNTSYYPLRLVTITGCVTSLFSLLIGIIYLIYKILYWEHFQTGMAPIVIGMFFLGSIQLFTLGMIGEYIVAISKKINGYSNVYELERINYEERAGCANEKIHK